MAYEKGEIIGMLTMHVDDLLMAGCPKKFAKIAGELQGTSISVGSTTTSRFDRCTPVAIDASMPTSCLFHVDACLEHQLGEDVEANKLLRFAKQSSKIHLKFPSFAQSGVRSWQDLGFLALSDAAWATRMDGESQGGYLILAVPNAAFDDQATQYSVVDWRSFKLARVARSSLSAETQGAAAAADALEYVKTFWRLVQRPSTSLLDSGIRMEKRSALVVDAKSLHDALKKEAVVQGGPKQKGSCRAVGAPEILGLHRLGSPMGIVRATDGRRAD